MVHRRLLTASARLVMSETADLGHVTEEDLRKLFGVIDEDNDGKVTLGELKSFNTQTARRHAEKFFKLPAWMDEDEDGKLSFEEVKEANHKIGMSTHNIDPEGIKKEHKKEEVKFQEVDADNDGVLSQSELVLFFHPNLDTKASAVEAAHLMDTLDKDEDGVLSESEFQAKSGPVDFQRVDTNGDGKIQLAELEQMSSGALDFAESMRRMTDIADQNGDGSVTLEELLAAREALAKKGEDRYLRSWQSMRNEL
ncbi:Reticulocalbin-3 [Symbiodinium microadriaticum]|uniref:Reticulocalbin-3 n=1 Tax=Symbiodinium microadriaticum TaxID=2951 RepID=A0A1Q9DGG7_SYMMI|nr:Reticulocalbin-3 [Symbiodinium microadriaticum]